MAAPAAPAGDALHNSPGLSRGLWEESIHLARAGRLDGPLGLSPAGSALGITEAYCVHVPPPTPPPTPPPPPPPPGPPPPPPPGGSGPSGPWLYSAAEADLDMPASLVTFETSDYSGLSGWRQRGARGNGDGVNGMLIAKTEYTAYSSEPNTAYDAGSDTLGVAAKGGPTPAGGGVSLTAHQFIIGDGVDNDITGLGNTGDMGHIGDLANILVLGSDASGTTIGDNWSAAGGGTSFDTYRLDYTTTAVLLAGANVPHAIVLQDRLTTLSPGVDGVDNDGDGATDELDEQLIHGTININTAPRVVLQRVLPIPDATIRDAWINAILAYRDYPGDAATTPKGARPTGHRIAATDEGFAYLAEVYNAYNANNVDANNGTSGDFSSEPLTTGAKVGDTAVLGTPAITIDFTSNRNNTTSPTLDVVDDDREERAWVMRMLSQVASVRSDIFAVHIELSAFSNTASSTPDERRRYVAILDRSRVTGTGGAVRVLGVLEY